MGVYEITCPECNISHLWFSGNQDQRCQACITAGHHIEAVSAITKPSKSNLEVAIDCATVVFLIIAAAAFAGLCGLFAYAYPHIVVAILVSASTFFWAANLLLTAIKDEE